MQFVDIANDIAFRKIFGTEAKKKSLISFQGRKLGLSNADLSKLTGLTEGEIERV